MPGGFGDEFDFFFSRRGSVAAVAREVADVLIEKGYQVIVQDYDIRLGAQEIDERITALRAEITRLEARRAKQASLSAAAAFFKFDVCEARRGL